MNRLSRLFQPLAVAPKNAIVKNHDHTSRSQKLMLDIGLIRGAGNGTFHLLPMAQRAVDKCTRLVDRHMRLADAQKITMPLLTPADLWRKSGRFTDDTATELLTTRDRHEKLQILGPTHEESITALLAACAPITYRQFPLRLYQINTKFRDELKPRFGLMRAKEFLMKDGYTFDVDRPAAVRTYELMRQTYDRLFEAIGVPWVAVQAATGTIGGTLSHEYQFPAAVGEDQLLTCAQCGHATNVELLDGGSDGGAACGRCGSAEPLRRSAGIEVAHTFLLEQRYTRPLGATFVQANGKPAALWMGCYGIGITRLIAASVECMSTAAAAASDAAPDADAAERMRWPPALAPFSVCVIPPKAGSREEAAVAPFAEQLYERLSAPDGGGCVDDVIVDDRTGLTIGRRLLEAKRFGYPIVVVAGPKAAPGAAAEARFEFHRTLSGGYAELTLDDVVAETRRLTAAWR